MRVSGGDHSVGVRALKPESAGGEGAGGALDVEYEVNLKAELEIMQLHEKVDRLSDGILVRLGNLEKSIAQAVNGESPGGRSTRFSQASSGRRPRLPRLVRAHSGSGWSAAAWSLRRSQTST